MTQKTPQKYISEQRQNKPDKQSSVQHVSETSCHRPLATKRIKKKITSALTTWAASEREPGAACWSIPPRKTRERSQREGEISEDEWRECAGADEGGSTHSAGVGL